MRYRDGMHTTYTSHTEHAEQLVSEIAPTLVGAVSKLTSCWGVTEQEALRAILSAAEPKRYGETEIRLDA